MTETCVNCVHYRPKGIRKKYTACAREGAIELAGEERRIGDCGPDATLKDDGS
jgi:hypothetical protein